MFESYTSEMLLDEVLDNAPEGIDLRQGSIYYDAIAGIVEMIARHYADLDLILTLSSITTATGEYLDARAAEYSVTRLSSTTAKYHVNFVGATPNIGERFFAAEKGLYFVLRVDESDVNYLEAEIPGESGNNIYSGTPAIPVNSIQGLESATFGTIYIAGADAEDDESLRQRIQEKISGPSEYGNKQHYKSWCESFDAVGRAWIYPLWNGPNTVMAVLISRTGGSVDDETVSAVQEYIDPATMGYTTVVNGRTYTVGDGLGEGVANLGAHFTAVSATVENITVHLVAELKAGYALDTVQKAVVSALDDYRENLVLGSDGTNIIIRYTAIAGVLSNTEGLVDYSNLTLNGGTGNILLQNETIPEFQVSLEAKR